MCMCVYVCVCVCVCVCVKSKHEYLNSKKMTIFTKCYLNVNKKSYEVKICRFYLNRILFCHLILISINNFFAKNCIFQLRMNYLPAIRKIQKNILSNTQQIPKCNTHTHARTHAYTHTHTHTQIKGIGWTYFHLPVNCRSLADRCGSLGSCKPQINT